MLWTGVVILQALSVLSEQTRSEYVSPIIEEPYQAQDSDRDEGNIPENIFNKPDYEGEVEPSDYGVPTSYLYITQKAVKPGKRDCVKCISHLLRASTFVDPCDCLPCSLRITSNDFSIPKDLMNYYQQFTCDIEKTIEQDVLDDFEPLRDEKNRYVKFVEDYFNREHKQSKQNKGEVVPTAQTYDRNEQGRTRNYKIEIKMENSDDLEPTLQPQLGILFRSFENNTGSEREVARKPVRKNVRKITVNTKESRRSEEAEGVEGAKRNGTLEEPSDRSTELSRDHAKQKVRRVFNEILSKMDKINKVPENPETPDPSESSSDVPMRRSGHSSKPNNGRKRSGLGKYRNPYQRPTYQVTKTKKKRKSVQRMGSTGGGQERHKMRYTTTSGRPQKRKGNDEVDCPPETKRVRKLKNSGSGRKGLSKKSAIGGKKNLRKGKLKKPLRSSKVRGWMGYGYRDAVGDKVEDMLRSKHNPIKWQSYDDDEDGKGGRVKAKEGGQSVHNGVEGVSEREKPNETVGDETNGKPEAEAGAEEEGETEGKEGAKDEEGAVGVGVEGEEEEGGNEGEGGDEGEENEEEGDEGAEAGTEGDEEGNEGEEAGTEGDEEGDEGEEAGTEGDEEGDEGEEAGTEGEQEGTEGEEDGDEGAEGGDEGDDEGEEEGIEGEQEGDEGEEDGDEGAEGGDEGDDEGEEEEGTEGEQEGDEGEEEPGEDEGAEDEEGEETEDEEGAEGEETGGEEEEEEEEEDEEAEDVKRFESGSQTIANKGRNNGGKSHSHKEKAAFTQETKNTPDDEDLDYKSTTPLEDRWNKTENTSLGVTPPTTIKLPSPSPVTSVGETGQDENCTLPEDNEDILLKKHGNNQTKPEDAMAKDKHKPKPTKNGTDSSTTKEKAPGTSTARTLKDSAPHSSETKKGANVSAITTERAPPPTYGDRLTMSVHKKNSSKMSNADAPTTLKPNIVEQRSNFEKSAYFTKTDPDEYTDENGSTWSLIHVLPDRVEDSLKHEGGLSIRSMKGGGSAPANEKRKDKVDKRSTMDYPARTTKSPLRVDEREGEGGGNGSLKAHSGNVSGEEKPKFVVELEEEPRKQEDNPAINIKLNIYSETDPDSVYRFLSRLIPRREPPEPSQSPKNQEEPDFENEKYKFLFPSRRRY